MVGLKKQTKKQVLGISFFYHHDMFDVTIFVLHQNNFIVNAMIFMMSVTNLIIVIRNPHYAHPWRRPTRPWR